VRHFQFTLRAPGSQVLTVRDGREGWLPGRAALRVLRPGDLHFDLEAPETVPAGRPFGVTVNIMDPAGRWQNGYRGKVHFTCTDPGALLPGDYGFSGSESLHTFTSSLTLKTAGKQTLTVTDTALPKLTASATVTVRPAPQAGPSGSP
jgi:hypothetical protein